DVAVFEHLTVNTLLVDVGAVRAFQILDDEFAAVMGDAGMVAGDRRIVDHHGVVGQASDLQGVGPELELFEDLLTKPQHYLRHLRLLLTRLISSRQRPPTTSTITTVTLSVPPLRFAAAISSWQISCGSRMSAMVDDMSGSGTIFVSPSLHSSR